jgi:hypothetical protein
VTAVEINGETRLVFDPPRCHFLSSRTPFIAHRVSHSFVALIHNINLSSSGNRYHGNNATQEAFL